MYWIVLFALGLQDLDYLQNMKYHIVYSAAGLRSQMFEYLKKKKIVLLDHSLCKRHPDYPDHPDYSVFNWMIWIIWILHITNIILDFS